MCLPEPIEVPRNHLADELAELRSEMQSLKAGGNTTANVESLRRAFEQRFQALENRVAQIDEKVSVLVAERVPNFAVRFQEMETFKARFVGAFGGLIDEEGNLTVNFTSRASGADDDDDSDSASNTLKVRHNYVLGGCELSLI